MSQDQFIWNHCFPDLLTVQREVIQPADLNELPIDWLIHWNRCFVPESANPSSHRDSTELMGWALLLLMGMSRNIPVAVKNEGKEVRDTHP